MKIIIIGAGIGGLTTALCCLHHGHEVVVLERAPELGAVGAGIQTSPNAMKVFQALGMDALIGKNAFPSQAMEARFGKSGQHILSVPFAEKALKRWGAPYLHLYRPDLIDALIEGVNGRADIKLNHEVTHYAQSSTGVTVTLANREEITGDVLIGADGIHSRIRTQMHGEDKHRFTGNVAWRAVIPSEKLGDLMPNPTSCVWCGAGKHAVTYLLQDGKLLNFVGVVETDEWSSESWTQQGRKEDALKDFEGWHPIITNMIEQADILNRTALFDRPPLNNWVDGQVALLGDAAHPMLPFMAQGASMAIEDAWIIAHCLAQNTDINAALTQYQQARHGRTSKLQAISRRNAKIFHRRTIFGKLATYGPMWFAGKLLPSLAHMGSDGVYGYDVTKS